MNESDRGGHHTAVRYQGPRILNSSYKDQDLFYKLGCGEK